MKFFLRFQAMNETKPKELLKDSVDRTQSHSLESSSTSQTASTLSSTTKMNLKNIKGQDVVLGQLSDDFLRIDNGVDGSNRSSSSLSNATQNQIESDGQLALNLQRQYNLQTSSSMFGNEWFANYRAELSITFIEAHLVKNYGLMNMNVYVRMRVGNTIYETKNSNRGGKNPKWGETCCV